jgi:hypothetical protein
MTRSTDVDGILLVYHHFPAENAPTIMEYVEAFDDHSAYPVVAVNTDCGFPRILSTLRFRAIVLHYSVFGGDYYLLSRRYQRFLRRSRASYKIAIFQDEFRFARKRFEFLNRYGIDAVYTLVDPEYHEAVYGRHTSVPNIKTVLTGYVSDELVSRAKQLTVPDDERTIDVGYRARKLPLWMGRGAQEKCEIAERFVEQASGLALRLDIDTGEENRIYGGAWYEFVASCRGMLGVEAGTSLFDLDDTARERTEALLAKEPDLDIDEIERRVLHEYEGNIPHRVLSPRHFEAAAFHVCPIMYEGEYSGVLEPDVHYLALKKDWSNFDSVMARFVDADERRKITDRAYADLIASGRYSYGVFIQDFDEHMRGVGLGHSLLLSERRRIERKLRSSARRGRVVAHPRDFVRHLRFPGRRSVASAYQRIRRSLDR